MLLIARSFRDKDLTEWNAKTIRPPFEQGAPDSMHANPGSRNFREAGFEACAAGLIRSRRLRPPFTMMADSA